MADRKNKSFRLSANHLDVLHESELILQLDVSIQRILLIMGFIAMALCATVFLAFGADIIIFWANAIGAVILFVSLMFHFFGRMKRINLMVVYPFFIFIFIPIIWQHSAGIFGCVPMIALFFTVLLALADRTKLRTAFTILYGLILISLTASDFFRLTVMAHERVGSYVMHAFLFAMITPASWFIIATYRNHTTDHHTDIYHQSITDGLTGCYNKRYGKDRLSRLHAQYLSHQQPYSIILFDIDHFKMYNDKYGHHVGDSVLIKLCNCILKTTRQHDMLVRYGGDEFILVLPGTRLPQAKAAATLLQGRLSKLKFEQFKEPITVSIGVIDAEHAQDDDMDIVRQADLLMYKAKWKGRNCIVSDDMADTLGA